MARKPRDEGDELTAKEEGWIRSTDRVLTITPTAWSLMMRGHIELDCDQPGPPGFRVISTVRP